jgi:hypothetical protein
MEQLLDVAVQVVLSGAGAGTAQAGPQSGQRWQVTRVNVSTFKQVPSTCQVFAGPQAQAQWALDSTITANSDATNRPATLYPGNYIFAAWTGGQAGDTAVLRVTGTIETGYRRSG